jgi:hypothetical protein
MGTELIVCVRTGTDRFLDAFPAVFGAFAGCSFVGAEGGKACVTI